MYRVVHRITGEHHRPVQALGSRKIPYDDAKSAGTFASDRMRTLSRMRRVSSRTKLLPGAFEIDRYGQQADRQRPIGVRAPF